MRVMMAGRVELRGYNSEEAFKFFFGQLEAVVHQTPGVIVTEGELIHVASVLAHFSQVSTVDNGDSIIFTPTSIRDIFDNFIGGGEAIHTSAELMEVAAAQTLFMAGFFRNQKRAGMSMEWCNKLGSGFYLKASLYTPEVYLKKKDCLLRMSANFSVWAECCRKLNRIFQHNQDLRYLLKGVNPGS